MRNRLLGLALAAGGTLLLVGATPANAASEPATESNPSASALVLTSNPGEEVSPFARSVALTCQPAGGTHPEPVFACNELASVDGDINKLDVRTDQACTFIYAPVTVTATGVWDGRKVEYKETFPNDCVLTSYTGHVFRF
ncbi:protease [Longimycelium tulufanense]|uniref:Protease n=1 Tax=Longimycelium tulufanense TaxID=907463 RepID=A0A8J3C887_9PSEU|nr:SSI family serine proteinase inhibitor [Longimycelium tulufanense]GGM53332.1 protease [Longimycelium tulufanense]